MSDKSIFKEIITDYTDDNGVTHLDGYKSDDPNAEGMIIAYVINGEPYWTNAELQHDPMVKEALAEVVREQQES